MHSFKKISAIILTGSLLFASCSKKNCEDSADEFSLYFETWSTSSSIGDCDGMEDALPDVLAAYENLCDEEKAQLESELEIYSSDDIAALHDNLILQIGCGCEAASTNFGLVWVNWSSAASVGDCAEMETLLPSVLEAYNNLCAADKAIFASQSGLTDEQDIIDLHDQSLIDNEC
jgi:hypothetical protein